MISRYSNKELTFVVREGTYDLSVEAGSALVRKGVNVLEWRHSGKVQRYATRRHTHNQEETDGEE
jgi:hypothetical protein